MAKLGSKTFSDNRSLATSDLRKRAEAAATEVVAKVSG